MDPLTIGLFALLALMIFFMFRNSKKRQREAEALRERMVPGVEVMTQQGIYGTLLSLDTENNIAVIETTPGTSLRVHSQTLAKVVEDDIVDDEVEEAEVEREAIEAEPTADVASTPTTSAAADAEPVVLPEPEFGERTDDEKPKRAPRKKAGE
jgi:preprotein translocase subunit YajC